MNRLSEESSPYLRQHAENPVDWFPWGHEAFEKAKREDKPIFLSIGYSTCHWCHVMAEESFQDKEMADLINRTFISIKVDREERPDIDEVYMRAAVLATGRGGWPLTILMTPEKVPFFTATYIPRTARYGMMGLEELIMSVDRMWKKERKRLLSSADSIRKALVSSSNMEKGPGPSEDILNSARKAFERVYDERYGGFGRAPKFPSPHQIIYLLRYGSSYGDENAIEMGLRTLRQMRMGGIYDQVGGGFHRYSTDERWLLPHFEKMLYDQAMHVMAYTEAYQMTGDPLFKETVLDTAGYVISELTGEQGGFISAQDADSDGEEGAFYTWTRDEVISILGDEKGDTFCRLFGVKEGGNFREESTGRSTGKNVLHLKEYPRDHDTAEMLSTLRKEREKRPRPGKDDKVLTDWNALMISALARAYQVLKEEELLKAAEKALDHVLSNMVDGKGRLLHGLRHGKDPVQGMLDDHSYMGNALLDLYETTFETTYLRRALDLSNILLEEFLDRDGGGFYGTPERGEKLLVRPKDAHDGAKPSGNSSAFHLLIRLSRITGGPELERAAMDLYKAFSPGIERAPTGHAWMLTGNLHLAGPSKEIVIAGDPMGEETRRMLDIIRETYVPNKVLLLKREQDKELETLAPYTKDSVMLEGKPTVYVCQGWNCSVPTADPELLRDQLRS